MARSSDSIRAKRINSALELLNGPLSSVEAAQQLTTAAGEVQAEVAPERGARQQVVVDLGKGQLAARAVGQFAAHRRIDRNVPEGRRAGESARSE